MTLPNFLIAGAMKAGTTWLAQNLQEHPQIFIAPEELHFFNNPKNFAKGLSWYQRHFQAAGSAQAIGEKTAGYFLQDPYPSLIHKFLPNIKIIAVFTIM
ncbi:MAG: sulfotransferase [Prochlorothrix sp.]